MEKIDCVLLVDDTASTNYYNKKIISDCANVDHIEETKNGKEALSYILKEGKYSERNYPKPNIIFLDINMPVMNGFEFIEKVAATVEDTIPKTLIVILTTSNWSKDIEKAKESELIFDFFEKPLTCKKFNEVAKHYAKNYINYR